DGLPGRLAEDVPQGDLDAAHRLDGGALPAEEDRALVHAVDEAVDLEGVLAHDALGQPAADLVRQGRLDDRLRHPRRGIDLAGAGEAGVGVDLDDEGFLAAVAALVDLGQAQVDRLDAGDFHLHGRFRSRCRLSSSMISSMPTWRWTR